MDLMAGCYNATTTAMTFVATTTTATTCVAATTTAASSAAQKDSFASREGITKEDNFITFE
jgi:hypothetical protein